MRHVLPASGADCYRPLPSVNVCLSAGDRRAGDPICQGESCDLATAVLRAVGSLADLATLWRIDPVQADTLSVDLQGAAVNCGRLPQVQRPA